MDPEAIKKTKYGSYFSIGIISIIYAAVLNITEDLAIQEYLNKNIQPDTEINLAVFVPAIAAIIFGKGIGASAAALGHSLDLVGTNLLASAGGDPATIAIGDLITLVADSLGAWTVGVLTKRPEGKWDSITSRFKDRETWGRIGNNTVGGLVGIALAESFVSAYGRHLAEELTEDTLKHASSIFVEQFFISAVILLIFIPATLFFYELGDVLIEVRDLRIDQQLRKLSYMTPEEAAVAISNVVLPDKAFTKDTWTSLKINFRNKLDKATSFKIESVSTARCYPPEDKTKVLEPGETWEQNFFVLPSKQSEVDAQIRISPTTVSSFYDDTKELHTILEIKGKSRDPHKDAFTMLVFSIANSIIVAASIIYSNFVTVMDNLENAADYLQDSGALLGIVGAIELAVFIPILYYMRRTIMNISEEATLKLSFGTDISTHKIVDRFERRIDVFIDQFRESFSLFVKIILIAATVISIIVLGVEGFRVFDGSSSLNDYPQYARDLMIIGIGVFIAWVLGLRGAELLKQAGLIPKDKYLIKEKGAVEKFEPLRKFQEGVPNEVILTVKNTTKQPGVRVRLVGFDTVSPALVELKVPSGGKGTFKAAVTPIATGTRDILAVTYPLYDTKGNYIDPDEAEPYSNQHLGYDVMPETQLGLTKDQTSTLKKLGIIAVALGAIIYAASRYIGGETVEEAFSLIRDNAPYLLAMQAPFVYAYFYFQNKFQTSQFDIMNILDQLSSSQAVMEEMDKTVGKSLGASIKGNVKTAIKGQITTMAGDLIGDETTKQISALIEEHVGVILAKERRGDISTEIRKDVEKETKKAVLGEIEKTIEKELGKELTKTIEKTVKEIQKARKEAGSLKEATKSEVKANVKKQVGPPLKKKIESEYKPQLKAKLKETIREKFTKKVAPKLAKEIKKKIEQTLIKDLDKTLYKELEKQLDSLVDKVFVEVEKNMDSELRQQLEEKLQEKLRDRRLTQKIAAEFDDQLGSNYASQLEEGMGTALETEVGQKIKAHLEKEIEEKITSKLKEQLRKDIEKEIKKRLKSHVKKIIEEQVERRISETIDQAIAKTTEESIERFINETTDRYVDNTIDKYVDRVVKKLE